IYGTISTLLTVLAQHFVPSAFRLDETMFLLIFTMGLPFLWKSQSHRDELIRPRFQAPTLSDIIENTKDKSGIGFISITKILLDLSYDFTHTCPECGLSLDFRERYEWYGPTAFICPYCERIIHLDELGL
ncbi:MAG: hypothetical protein RTU30_13085, partial [Candidatus Thorarchaeota archaeon]